VGAASVEQDGGDRDHFQHVEHALGRRRVERDFQIERALKV
jgi:hypothetical protein